MCGENTRVGTNVVATGIDWLPGDNVVLSAHERTRLIAISYVSRKTGRRLPVEGIVAAAHARNVPVLVDGAEFGVDGVRVSTHVFNTESEAGRLVTGLPDPWSAR
jgi:selenocysteine lyase/cysteine desulfurase